MRKLVLAVGSVGVLAASSACGSDAHGSPGPQGSARVTTPQPANTQNSVELSCARQVPLTSLISASAKRSGSWILGTISPSGVTRLGDLGERDALREVYTMFHLSVTRILVGHSVPAGQRSIEVWVPGGKLGARMTKAGREQDLATTRDGGILAEVFPSAAVPGHYMFEGIPANSQTVQLIDVGCWSAAAAAANPSHSNPVTATVLKPQQFVIYHNGTAQYKVLRPRAVRMSELQRALPSI